MALEDLVESIDVTTERVTIKFSVSLKTSSILNSSFIVSTVEATPHAISNPFETIDTDKDYNPVSRILILSWKVTLSPLTSYNIKITGLLNVANVTLKNESIQFTTLADVTNPVSIPAEPTPSIVDKSLYSSVFSSIVINSANLAFTILESDPINGDFYLPPDYNRGRLTIEFTKRPDTYFVNSDFFKVQRRHIQRGPTRWETIVARMSLDSNNPWVYIDFPSTDYYPEAATPASVIVYYTAGYSYFNKNYKYRVIVSKNVTT